MAAEYIARTYRDIAGRYVSFEVAVFETDLKIYLDKGLEKDFHRIIPLTTAYIKVLRAELIAYIEQNPAFAAALNPWHDDKIESPLVKEMVVAGNRAGVGPMAAVAGAVATFVANYLKNYSQTVIVENGGDIYVFADTETVVGVFAGESPLSMKLGLVVPPLTTLGICTSSGTVGPALSFGRADAVCVATPNAALADALATTLGNIIQSANDFEAAMRKAQSYNEILSVLFICGDKSAIWGGLEIRPVG